MTLLVLISEHLPQLLLELSVVAEDLVSEVLSVCFVVVYEIVYGRLELAKCRSFES